MLRRPSGRRPSTIKKISETAWPIKAKFHVEPPLEGGTKVYINGPGQTTEIATMPTYGKKLKTFKRTMSYDLEPWQDCSIGDSSSTKFI